MRVKNVPPNERLIYLIAAIGTVLPFDYLPCDIDKRLAKAVS
jgi:hypothetical protein